MMHHPLLFKRVHRVHHLSTNPSPLAAYSFHPFEAVVEALFFPVIILLVPVHFSVIVAFVVIDLGYNVLGHLGHELYPKGFTSHPIGKWNNTSTHHNMHHRYFNANYGLYFNVWDRICGTNHARYEATFERVVHRRDASN